ncbi:Pycsar system effector family protein [Streptomyces rimosus]|uniref:Pycsar system effector family protein n=1 Tax=Streptomyces rimosus TaxID=1927 RepID=UPI00067AB783|nr:Pycsar system effector family protein [Streptomyces rimosus]
MTATQPAPTRVEERIARTQGEIARTDTKASILLAALAIVAGPLASNAGTLIRSGWPTATATILAVLLAGAAAWLLLDVVLPRLNGSGTDNFIHYARCTRAELIQALHVTADPYHELITLAQIADAKMRRLRTAGLLLKLAAVPALAAAALAIAAH